MSNHCVEQLCLVCRIRLGENVSPIKKYCDKCRVKKNREYNKIKCSRAYYKRKLKRVFEDLKIPIIQTPYLVDVKTIDIKVRNLLR